MRRGARIRVSPKEQRTVDGIVFDSKREAQRYGELKMLERVGSVTDIELQPEYELIPPFEYRGKRERAIKYRADFRYKLHGQEIVEDVKGHRTEVYKIKRKMLLHRYPDIDFREVS
jgi:hypothetical protein